MARRRETSLPDYRTYGDPDETAFANGFNPETARPVVPRKPLPKPPVVTKKPNHDMYSSTQQVNTSTTTILGANPARRYLMIQNNGAVNVFLGFGSSAQVNGDNSIIMPPSSVYTFENGVVPNNNITAVVAAGTSSLSIVEGRESN